MPNKVAHKEHVSPKKAKAAAKPAQESPLKRLEVLRFAETALHELGIDPKITPKLMTAMAYPESTFRPHAKGANGATGLIQIKPGSADDYGITASQLTDPIHSLRTGAKYLNDLLTQSKSNLKEALQRYKCGPDNYKEPNCTKYADSILKAAKVGTPDPAVDPSGKVVPWLKAPSKAAPPAPVKGSEPAKKAKAKAVSAAPTAQTPKKKTEAKKKAAPSPVKAHSASSAHAHPPTQGKKKNHK